MSVWSQYRPDVSRAGGCRQRIQQATLGHRGWQDDPLYGVRRLLVMAPERLDEVGWARLRTALDDGGPDAQGR